MAAPITFDERRGACYLACTMRVIDFHTHAFPDKLAERAMPALEREGHVKGCHDGKVASLLRCMDEAGIERAALCSIATKPEQFLSILKWSREVSSERLTAFPSIHPADPEAVARLNAIREAGFQGVKLHPYYQEFVLDEPRMFPIYERAQELNLILVCHTGYDIAFPRERRCDPEKILRVHQGFPRLKFIATHLGAWEMWDDVERLLIGKPIYLETSFSIELLGRERARRMILAHPKEYVLFGTDSPWTSQPASIRSVQELKLGDEREEAILFENAERLLCITR